MDEQGLESASVSEEDQNKPRLSDLFSLSEVPDRVPRRLHKSTPYSWVNPGIRGVRLRVTSVGGQLHTCEAWLMDFFEAVAASRLRHLERIANGDEATL